MRFSRVVELGQCDVTVKENEVFPMNKVAVMLLVMCCCFALAIVSFACNGNNSKETDATGTPLGEEHRAIDLMCFIPEYFDEFGYIDIGALTGDEDLRHLASGWDDAELAFGFTPEQTVWAYYEPSVQNLQQLGIFTGRINTSEIRDKLDKHLSPVNHKGIDLWVGEPPDSTVSFIDDKYIFGDKESIEDCIEVSLGEQLALCENVDFTGIIDRLPNGLRIQFWKDRYIHQKLKYTGLEITGLSITKGDNSYLDIFIVAKFQNPIAAANSTETIRSDMENYSKATAPDPFIADLIDYTPIEFLSVSVEQDEEFVIVNAKRNIPQSADEDLY